MLLRGHRIHPNAANAAECPCTYVDCARGAYIAFDVCAHEQGGLHCSRVPHRPAGVLVAPC
jgi:hypothetical protein